MKRELIRIRCRAFTSRADRDEAIRRERAQYKHFTICETHDHTVTVEGIEFGVYVLIVKKAIQSKVG